MKIKKKNKKKSGSKIEILRNLEAQLTRLVSYKKKVCTTPSSGRIICWISLFDSGEEESWPLLLCNLNWIFSSSQNCINVISSDTQDPVHRLTPQQIVGWIFATRGSWTVLDSKAVQRKRHRTALYPPLTH